MLVSIRIGSWEELKAGASEVRHQVFVVEQQVPVELELDERDADCLHALACDDDDRPIATARLLPDAHIGRMAVLPSSRGSGIGGAILQALMARARERGDSAVVLNAQTHAEEFYRRHGFIREGDEFIEAGIAHIHMRHVFPA
jgi:predicted GNAT family N-acyltransferase